MKKGIFLIALLLAAIQATADDIDYNMLVVQMRDGTYDTYNLETFPKVTYDGAEVVIKSELVETRYERAKVRNLNFGDEQTGIVQTAAADGFRFTFKGNLISLEGLKAGTAVDVFTADGRLTGTTRVSGNGEASMSLEGHPAGIYIIKAEKQRTIKVIKI